MTNEEKNALEAAIDRYGLSHVVAILSDICGEKADHVRTNWQDHSLANCWEKCSSQLQKIIPCTQLVDP